jgi:hypothetical protein
MPALAHRRIHAVRRRHDKIDDDARDERLWLVDRDPHTAYRGIPRHAPAVSGGRHIGEIQEDPRRVRDDPDVWRRQNAICIDGDDGCAAF